jgi:hypothetical protein
MVEEGWQLSKWRLVGLMWMEMSRWLWSWCISTSTFRNMTSGGCVPSELDEILTIEALKELDEGVWAWDHRRKMSSISCSQGLGLSNAECRQSCWRKPMNKLHGMGACRCPWPGNNAGSWRTGCEWVIRSKVGRDIA